MTEGRDPRRIDLRASARDPFQRLYVRIFHQQTAIPVYAVADLSASMSVGRKPAILADFVASLAYSAYRTGDSFGFVGCDRRLRDEFLLPLTRMRAAGQLVAEKLRSLRDWGPDSSALVNAVNRFDGRRALVFVLSDFLFPMSQLGALFTSLARHLVVPVVVRDSTEDRQLPSIGVLHVTDSETGATRTVLARPTLNRKIRRAAEERDRTLQKVASRLASPPLYLVDRLQVDDVTEYFLVLQ